ncbi:MAG: glycine/sarcosine/betaine reductase complex component C subunit alpha [Clostridiales bacterium]|nr:glycine/sarcosine/betaine reductase complex component C subunit alpha [Clostridiales bacterium]
MQDNIRKTIGEVFSDIADAIESGSFINKVRVGITVPGSEHGTDEIIKAAKMAMTKYGDFDVVLIGAKHGSSFESYEADTLEEAHKKMEELLNSKRIDCAVTMHYNFPIGVSTVGRVITPGCGREVFISASTGTSSANRAESIFKNALYGIIVAKASGNLNPSIGILNIDGARQAERALKELQRSGYNINFAASVRKDGGSIMRGNDLLHGTCDVMVTDSLTGNILVKLLSSFTTGGSYESTGYGYGPGIGEGYNKVISIVSRASGAPVICEALRYAATMVKNGILDIAGKEFEAAKKAGYNKILDRFSEGHEKKDTIAVNVPPKKVVTYQIAGVDILELEDAVKELWENDVYSESGMGCTGPIILVSSDEGDKARGILIKKGYLSPN